MRLWWLAAVVLTGLASAQTLHWHTSLTQAWQDAAKTHRPLAVLVVGRYCGWCRKLEREVLRDTAVQRRLSQYVTVKIVDDDTKTMRHLPPIEMVPTLFVYAPNRKLVDTIVGYYPRNDYLDLLLEASEVR